MTAITETPSLARSWLVWSCAALFFGYQFMLRLAPSVMTQDLMRDLHVDACSLGLLTSAYFYAYAGLQVPVGTALDRIGPRRLLTFAGLVCAAGCLLFSTAHDMQSAALARFLIGAGSAFGFLSCMKVGALWFPPQKLSMVVGFTLLVGTSGAFTGSAPMSALVESIGWRDAVGVTGLIGLVIAGLAWIIVRDKVPHNIADMIAQHHVHLDHKPSIRESFATIFKNPQTWYLAGYGILMYVPLAGFADMWGVPFLKTVHHLSPQSASLATSIFYIGIGLGTPLFAYISDRLMQFRLPLMISSLGMLACLGAVFYIPGLSEYSILGLMLGAGLFGGGQFLTYSIVCDINPIEMSGSATGVQNMICLTSGVIFQPLIGKILDLVWSGGYLDGVPSYSMSNFHIAVSIIPLCLILAWGTSFLIREVYPQDTQ